MRSTWKSIQNGDGILDAQVGHHVANTFLRQLFHVERVREAAQDDLVRTKFDRQIPNSPIRPRQNCIADLGQKSFR